MRLLSFADADPSEVAALVTQRTTAPSPSAMAGLQVGGRGWGWGARWEGGRGAACEGEEAGASTDVKYERSPPVERRGWGARGQQGGDGSEGRLQADPFRSGFPATRPLTGGLEPWGFP